MFGAPGRGPGQGRWTPHREGPVLHLVLHALLVEQTLIADHEIAHEVLPGGGGHAHAVAGEGVLEVEVEGVGGGPDA